MGSKSRRNVPGKSKRLIMKRRNAQMAMMKYTSAEKYKDCKRDVTDEVPSGSEAICKSLQEVECSTNEQGAGLTTDVKTEPDPSNAFPSLNEEIIIKPDDVEDPDNLNTNDINDDESQADSAAQNCLDNEESLELTLTVEEENVLLPEETPKPIPAMCVLCARDISRLRTTSSVLDDADVILAFTDVDVLQYHPIQPMACSLCYKTLSTLKAFRLKVWEACFYLTKKLSGEDEFEFAGIVATDENKTPIETTEVDMREMHVEDNVVIIDTKRDGNVVVLDVTEKPIPSNNRLPDIFNAAYPFSKCNICGKLYKDLANHKCSDVAKSDVEREVIPKCARTWCLICSKPCYKTDLKMHMKTHNRPKKQDGRICGFCGKTYRSGNYKNHAKNHASVCQFCGKFYPKGAYQEHMKIHYETCALCKCKYFRGNYELHMERHHPGVTLEHKVLPQDELTETTVEDEVRPAPEHDENLQDNGTVCEHCGKTYLADCYEEHAALEHFEVCPVCGDQYMVGYYRKHAAFHARMMRECEVCKEQIQVNVLKQHMSTHKSEERHVCFVCGKTYSHASGLRIHEVSHGEKKHQCSICGMSFHYAKYLQRHLRSHSGEKPYACSYCDRKFSLFWNRQQHERLHTNVKPYKCRLCPAAFRHNVVLKSHLSSKHGAAEIRDSIKEQSSGNDSEQQIGTVDTETSNKSAVDIPNVTNEQSSENNLEQQMNVDTPVRLGVNGNYTETLNKSLERSANKILDGVKEQLPNEDLENQMKTETSVNSKDTKLCDQNVENNLNIEDANIDIPIA